MYSDSDEKSFDFQIEFPPEIGNNRGYCYSDKDSFVLDIPEKIKGIDKENEYEIEKEGLVGPINPFIGKVDDKNIEKNDNDSTTKENTGPRLTRESSRIKEKIFDIDKVNKKQGRLSNQEKKFIKGKHDKFSEDNIIQKIKTTFQEDIFNYVNYEYEKFRLENQNNNGEKQINIVKLLKRISPEGIKKIKKNENLIWFTSNLKTLFSTKLSSKYTKFESNYNEKRIKKLYEKKEAKNVINILEKRVKDMYEIYINNIKIDGFATLEEDLIALGNQMEEKGEENIENYLKEYEKIAKDLEETFKSKISRKSKTKKHKKKINL